MSNQLIDFKKIKSQHAFVAMSESSLNLRRKLPRLNIPAPHPHLMFDGPVSKPKAAFLVFGTAFIGAGAVFASAWYAQRLKGLW